MIRNNNNKILMLLVLGLMLVVIGTTYALFVDTFESDANTITTGQITMSYAEPTNALEIAGATPMTDGEGMGQSEYFQFTVSTHAKTDADDTVGISVPYEINITPVAVAGSYTQLAASQVKVGLATENEVELVVNTVEGYSASAIRSGSKTVYTSSNTFKQNSAEVVTKYRLRMWIADTADQEELNQSDYEYRIKVNVDSRVKAIGSQS